ncbi:MAG: hypothetical protein IPP40_02415 [bacterium]|nr:hypothetical protein [bacterium]
MRKLLLFSLVYAMLLCAQQADARKKTHLPALDWGMRVGVSAIYNDNVLRLSGPDQNAFRSYDPAFHTPLETVDDGETELSLAPSIQWRAPANLMVNGSYRFKAVQRTKNDFTDYQTHSLAATIRPRERGYWWSARASAFTIPSFYLRVYRDRDYSTYDDARFESWEYNGEFALRPIEALWLAAQAGFGSNYYGKKFTEFDSEFTEFGLEARCATPWKPTLVARYTRRTSENIGKDQAFQSVPSYDSGNVFEDNEYGDGDNNEDEFRLAIRSPLRVTKNFVLEASLSSRLRRRVYTTNRSLEADPFHRGRLDNRWDISPLLSWSITSSLDLDAQFTYEQRTSESDAEGVARVKDFIRHEYSLGLTYKIN